MIWSILVRRLLVAFLAAAAGVGALALWFFSTPDDVDAFARGAPRSWAKLSEDRRESPKVVQEHRYLPLEAIPVEVQYAVLSGEDIGFLGHGAWDLAAMREALQEWLGGDKLRGGSTVTQQLAKNLFLSGDRSLWRKLREARYAYWLEARLGKRRILELYLNIVELGPGIYGIDSGARHYFGVPAAALDSERAAELSATIPSPLKHNPTTRTRSWEIRLEAIRERMGVYGRVRERLATLSGRGEKRQAASAETAVDETSAGRP